jgi:hypothetical protein
MIANIVSLLVKDGIVLEESTTGEDFTGVPLFTHVDLHNKADGTWFCCYAGFLDITQIVELSELYDLEFEPIAFGDDDPRIELNQRLANACTLEEAKKILAEAGVIYAVPDPIIVTPDEEQDRSCEAWRNRHGY